MKVLDWVKGVFKKNDGSLNRAVSDTYKPVSESKVIQKRNELSTVAENFINTQPGFILKGPIYIIFFILFTAVIYSFIAKVDTKVSTVLHVDGENYVVQSPVIGSVNSIVVSENQEVHSLDRIATILSENTLVTEENLSLLKSQLADLNEKIFHINYTLGKIVDLAISYGKKNGRFAISVPNELSGLYVNKDILLNSEVDYTKTWTNSEFYTLYNNLTVQLSNIWKGYQNQSQILDKQEKTLDEDKKLFDKNVITITQLNGSYNLFLNLQNSTEGMINNFKSELYSTIKNMLDLRNNYEQQTKQIQSNIRQIETMSNEVVIKDRVCLINSRYPGIIADIYVKPFEYVANGTPLLKIIRDDLPKTGVIFIGNQNIGSVKVGQKVFIKFEAYPYQEYGVQIGSIVEVAPDVKVVEGIGYVYVAKVAFDKVNPRINLKYGMRATAEISTGSKRLIELVFAPISKVFDYFRGNKS